MVLYLIRFSRRLCYTDTTALKVKAIRPLEIKVNMMRPLTQELPVIRAEGRTSTWVDRQRLLKEKLLG